MSKSIKLEGDNYIDSSGITHNRELLSEILKNPERVSYTRNNVDNIYYNQNYATANEVNISADIRKSFAANTLVKAFTIDNRYIPVLDNVDDQIRFPITTDKGDGGYAYINASGEVYVYTYTSATAIFLNMRYRYK